MSIHSVDYCQPVKPRCTVRATVTLEGWRLTESPTPTNGDGQRPPRPQFTDERLQARLKAVAVVWLLVIITLLVVAYVSDRSTGLDATVLGLLLSAILLLFGIQGITWLSGGKR